MNKDLSQSFDDVLSKLSDKEVADLDLSRVGYIFSKAELFLKIGVEKYRASDAFGQPLFTYEKHLLSDGCSQILKGFGLTQDRPLRNLGVSGFNNLFSMFHFKLSSRTTKYGFYIEEERVKGILDCITLEHVIDGHKVTYYNLC